ncbi:hypothetical protein F5Y18DRAFT_386578 [Xylariaceae sp. FL1019]|nr:hypothetical protein F5Y18DRAFT_386578 [Xylariaceae sp. FL1019]
MSRFRSRDNGGRAGPRPRRHNTRVRSDWESPTTSNAPPVEIPLSPVRSTALHPVTAIVIRKNLEADSIVTQWAERFPDTLAAWGRPTWVLDGDKRHSGFAIEYPSRDPKFYNDAIFDPDANPERPLNGPDLHRLFLSEAKQRISLRGLATWQAGPLNSWVDFGNAIGPVSGGNRTVDSLNNDLQTVWERGRIEVDESKWFPVFSRAHWYDLRGDATTVLSPEPPNGSFSVDDPNVVSVF